VRKRVYATFDADAFRELCVQAAASPGDETYGYLIGRPTRAGFRVHRVPLAPYVTTDDDSVYYADEDKARFDAAVASAFRGRAEVVGHWHTHVYKGRCADALVPQINDVDMESTPDGLLEVVCATYPTDDGPLASSDIRLAGAASGHACTLEAWVRRGAKFLPCCVRAV
jgi:hypothetical protein